MLASKIYFLLTLILLTGWSKTASIANRQNYVYEDEDSENEYDDADTYNDKWQDQWKEQKKWPSDSNGINVHDPYMNIVVGNSREWTNFDHAHPLKRSDNPLQNPPLEDLGLNMSNPLTKYHCPVNLLYGNNLTVKNFFLLMPRCNMSTNSTRETIKSIENQEGLEENFITIPPFSQNNLVPFSLPLSEPLTLSSMEGILSTNGVETTKLDYGGLNSLEGITNFPLPESDTTISVTGNGETTVSASENGETTGLSSGNIETTGTVSGNGEVTGSTRGNGESTVSVKISGGTTESISVNGGTTGSVGDNDETTGSIGGSSETIRSVIANGETTGSFNGNGETTGSFNGNGETTGSFSGQGETTGSFNGSGETTGSFSSNGETTGSLVIDNGEITPSVTSIAELSASVNTLGKVSEPDSGNGIATVSVKSYDGTTCSVTSETATPISNTSDITGSSTAGETLEMVKGDETHDIIYGRSTSTNEFPTTSITETFSTTFDMNYEVLRTIDKYCETFSMIKSDQGIITTIPSASTQEPAAFQLLNSINKNKQLPDRTNLRKHKRASFEKNPRKYFNYFRNAFI